MDVGGYKGRLAQVPAQRVGQSLRRVETLVNDEVRPSRAFDEPLVGCGVAAENEA